MRAPATPTGHVFSLSCSLWPGLGTQDGCPPTPATVHWRWGQVVTINVQIGSQRPRRVPPPPHPPAQVPDRSRVSPVASPATARTAAAASPGPDSHDSAFLAVLLNPRAWDPLGMALRIPVLMLYLKFGLFISKAEQKTDEMEPPSPVLTVRPAPWAPETLGHGDSLGLSL